MKATSALSLALAAGIASTAAANTTPTTVDATAGQIKHVAHIYYNIGTGEKISTLMDDTQRAVDGEAGSEIWVSDVGAQCQTEGFSSSFFYGVDTQSTTTGSSIIRTSHEFFFDWADIPFNTVVDCVQIHWITNHADVDTNPADGNADGVEGLAATWTYWDAMNGRAPQFDSIAMPIISIGFFSLPGETSDPGDSFVAFYTADIDLATSFGTSLTFEIGDNDSDLQGAAVHNPRLDLEDNEFVDSMTTGDGIPDIDPDQDGLADWGWSVIYDQPGTVDVDNADSDSDSQTGIDGDINAFATTGVVFGSPQGGAPVFDSVNGVWNWVMDDPSLGVPEDVFNTAIIDPNTNAILMQGPWWFGGIRCTVAGPPPASQQYRPAAHFQTILYGPSEPPCVDVADLNGDGELDFLDISIFSGNFASPCSPTPCVNVADLNGDGQLDFLDISMFSANFATPCDSGK